MYRGINIVHMYLAGDYPFNEYPGFDTFKKYLDVAKNDLNCNFIRLFLLKDFEEHYPDWLNRWIAVENLIQQHFFAVEYCTYMFWPSATIDIDSYKGWVDKYIGTYKTLGMPTDRIWVVNVLENPWVNYYVAQQMTPYIKAKDPDRTVTTEVWGTSGGMYPYINQTNHGEIIGLPSTKGEPLINSKVYIIPSGNLISTADYNGVDFISTTQIWNQIKTQASTSPVLMSEFSGDITTRVNLAVQNGAYGVCYWNLHVTDRMATDNEGIPPRCPINLDFTLNNIGFELQSVYRSLSPPLTVINLTGPDSVTIGTNVTFVATVRNPGATSDLIGVTFYDGTPGHGGTVIYIDDTGMIPAGGTGTVSATFGTSTWATGTFSVCAKTFTEP